ncbi:MAG: aminoacyl-tRNA hydrolase [Verrucomicrobiota bacterium]
MEPESKPTFRLLVGLGNPGREYEKTRHNVGFMILDRLASRDGAGFSFQKNWRAEIATHGCTIYCKPQSFMNLSGEPLAAVSRFYKIPANEILVVLDDAALPLGRLRIRPGGSTGGHNGLKSIVEQIGDVPRLRVGIGAASGCEMTGHVLGRFTAKEMPVLEESLGRAVEAIDFVRENGIEAAMNKFN